MRVPFVDLQAQYQSIKDEVQIAINAVLERGDFILGKDVSLLETEFADYVGSKYAIGVASGLAALELALKAYDIGPGDEVITAANTYIATALAISAVGATPVLVDMLPTTYNIDPSAISAAITSRTKAVIPVHLYGQSADLDPILAIAERHNLIVLEDAAQAHGTRYKGRRVGAFGQVGAFSFYPGKNLGAYGDGGMIVTNDSQIADKLKGLRNYGQKVKYHHIFMGTNSRLDSLQAAILRVKLKYLDNWNSAREANAATYNELLQGLNVKLPQVAEDSTHIYHLYVVQLEERQKVQDFLQSKTVDSGIHYPIPIHLQEAYKQLGYKAGDFPVTEAAAPKILSLPMYPELTKEQMGYVVDSLKQVM